MDADVRCQVRAQPLRFLPSVVEFEKALPKASFHDRGDVFLGNRVKIAALCF